MQRCKNGRENANVDARTCRRGLDIADADANANNANENSKNANTEAKNANSEQQND